MPELASTRDLLNAEQFIATDDHRTIITFHLQLLKYACRTGMVSKAQVGSIHQNTLAYLFNQFPASTLKQQNMLYCMNCFLKKKRNSDALDYLLKINSVSDVKLWFDETSVWIENQKRLMLTKLRSSQKYVSSQYQDAYNSLMEQINGIFNWSTGLSFAKLHRQVISTGNLILSKVQLSYSETYFEKLLNTIKDFQIEVAIMYKLNASEVLKTNSESEKDENEEVIRLITEIDCELASKANELKQKYEKSMSSFEDAQARFNLITADMSEEEFDEFVESDHPIAKEFARFDEIEIQAEFEKSMEELNQRMHEKRKAVYNRQKATRSNIVTSDIISLTLMIKEYALYVLATGGKVEYPETLDAKDKLLESIDQSTAIEILIANAEKFQLTEEEISYLRAIM